MCSEKNSADLEVTTWARVHCRQTCATCTSTVWGTWTEWSACQADCKKLENTNIGMQTRQRICYDEDNKASNKCDGKGIVMRKCRTKQCLAKIETTPVNEAPLCIDESPLRSCQQWKNRGMCFSNRNIAARCRNTCDQCPVSGITESTEIKNLEQTEVCVDKDERCKGRGKARCEGLFALYMKDNCPKFCGHCGDGSDDEENIENDVKIVNIAKLPKKLCIDANQDICTKYKNKCSDARISRQCHKTCEVCTNESEKSVTPAEPETTLCTDDLGPEMCLGYKDQCRTESVRGLCKKTCDACPKNPTNINTKAPLDACRDSNPVYCGQKSGECRTNMLVSQMCRKTCRLCTVTSVSSSSPVSAVKTPKQNVCADSNAMVCMKMKDKCSEMGVKFMCKATCGLCGGMGGLMGGMSGMSGLSAMLGGGSSGCKDKNQMVCMMQKSKCNSPMVKQMCPSTCGDCGGSSMGSMGSMASLLSGFSQPKSPSSSADPSCTDSSPTCAMMASKCASNNMIGAMCKKTCGKCGGASLFGGMSSMSGGGSSSCQDSNAAVCMQMSSKCGNSAIKTLCKKTCDECGSSLQGVKSGMSSQMSNLLGGKISAADCKDKSGSLCKIMKMQGQCSNPLMSKMCAISCGLCTPEGQTETQTIQKMDGATVSGSEKPEVCADENKFCKMMVSQCSSPITQKLCKQTCGQCGGTSTLSSLKTPKSSSTECSDKNENLCKAMASQCTTNPMVTSMCAKTCGKCGGSTSDCEDMSSSCSLMKSQCQNTMISAACKKTCNACGNSTPSIVASQKSSGSSCEDKSNMCGAMSSMCGQESISLVCAKTCGKCGSSIGSDVQSVQSTLNSMFTVPKSGNSIISSSNSGCEDSMALCGGMKSQCSSIFVSSQCKKTCGQCGSETVQFTMSGGDGEHSSGNPRKNTKTQAQINEENAQNFLTKMMSSTKVKTCTDGQIVNGKCCKNQNENAFCSMMKDMGECDTDIDIAFKCQLTCNTCPKADIPTKEELDQAQDSNTMCPLMSKKCNKEYIEKMCPATCATAKLMKVTEKDSCKDMMPMCPSYKDMCTRKAVKKMCPKTCRECPGDKPIVAATTTKAPVAATGK